MMSTNMKTLTLYHGQAADPGEVALIVSVSAPKIVVVSNYADLRGEADELIATITWKSPVTARLR